MDGTAIHSRPARSMTWPGRVEGQGVDQPGDAEDDAGGGGAQAQVLGPQRQHGLPGGPHRAHEQDGEPSVRKTRRWSRSTDAHRHGLLAAGPAA